ncbi:hypothetical protein [Nitrosopumilus zosterae]|uniref:hypothetical protein n=1 Tax=Nitrosopumilus zosterae TaxID=718286 RepID=UPI000D70098B|nr:hypothetical protein [Nitrosopumilus zosterae]BDQ31150.1 hypothetical protein NZOSNM25_001261 [Nitrosopumilus zosterae]
MTVLISLTTVSQSVVRPFQFVTVGYFITLLSLVIIQNKKIVRDVSLERSSLTSQNFGRRLVINDV